MRILVLLLAMLVACGGEERPARAVYNQGVAALAAGKHEEAQKLLLEARSQAGVDPELRFRAAYDLGMAYAAHSDQVKQGTAGPAEVGRAAPPQGGAQVSEKKGDLAKALELAQQALSWFNDAARLRTNDPNTLANLAIIRARVQALSDELRKGEGKLEARLDRLIEDQRAVLDDARGAWISIKQAGGTDPLAHQGTLTHLADRERGIVAEAGVVSDLAADEIDAIGKKAEDQRSDEEKVRVVQLKNLDLYLVDSRSRIAEARRKLQELAAEDGVTKAEAALVALKRAREQLFDPITVLRGLAQDEVTLLQETAYLAQPTGEVPAWLSAPKLAERQGGLRDRLAEVNARLTTAAMSEQQPQDPKQAKMLERVRQALAPIGQASSAMDRARDTLAGGKPSGAIEHEQAALVALGAAIELFADLKQTIELAHGDGKQVVGLLSPEAANVPAAERAKETTDAIARNTARLARLKDLIAEAAAEKPQAQGEQQPTPEQLAQHEQLYKRAEELRAQAEGQLAKLAPAIAANKDPLAVAKEVDATLVELRKLFFDVIQHLEQLIRDQGETRDETSQTHQLDPIAREPKLPTLVGKQTGHGEMAKAIADALAAQADAAAQAPQQPQPGAPDGKALSAAANEVRLGRTAMDDANRTLTKAKDSKMSSESIEPALGHQAKAIEHLEAALRHLRPPQDQPQDQQQQDQQQQQQQDQQQQDQQQQQQQQSGGASQRVRDEDARRQRERQQQQGGTDPVEKDW